MFEKSALDRAEIFLSPISRQKSNIGFCQFLFSFSDQGTML